VCTHYHHRGARSTSLKAQKQTESNICYMHQ
jgi:hypothetical protein